MAPQREWFEKDYYAVLGVPRARPRRSITRAYRKLAKQHHPDANPGNTEAEERFKEVSAAYDVLGDTDEAQGVRRGPRRWSRRASAAAASARRRCRRVEGGSSRSTSTSGGGLGDLLGGLFGRGAPRRRHAARGPAAAGPRRGARPRDRAPPRLRRRRARRHQHACGFTRRRDVLDVPRLGRRARDRARDLPQCGGTARSRSTRARSRSRRCAPRAAGAARSCTTRARRATAAGVEVRPREVKVRVPAGVDRRPAHPREGPRRGRRATAGRPATSTSSCTCEPHPLFGRSGQRPHDPRAGHVRRGGARRRGEGADARRAGDGARPGRHARAARSLRVRGAGIPTAERRPRRPARHARRRTCPHAAHRRASARRSRRSAQAFDRRTRARRPSEGADRWTIRRTRALYIISVAAELAGVHPQTLRIYERKGLIEPQRTERPEPPLLRPRHRAAAAHPGAHQRGVGLAGVRRILDARGRARGGAGRARAAPRQQLERAAPPGHRGRGARPPPVPPRPRPGAAGGRPASGAADRVAPGTTTLTTSCQLWGRRARGSGMPLDPNKFTRKTSEAIGAAQAAGPRRAATPRSRPSTCSRRSRPARGRRAPACSSASASTRRSAARPRSTRRSRSCPRSSGATRPRAAARRPTRSALLEAADKRARRARRRVPLDRAPAARDDRASPAVSATCCATFGVTHDAVLDALKQVRGSAPRHERQPRGAVPGAREVRPRPHRGRARKGKHRSGHRARRGDPPGHPGAVASHEEQPGAHRRARRGQDRDRRGARPPHRRGRRPRGPARQARRSRSTSARWSRARSTAASSRSGSRPC